MVILLYDPIFGVRVVCLDGPFTLVRVVGTVGRVRVYRGRRGHKGPRLKDV